MLFAFADSVRSVIAIAIAVYAGAGRAGQSGRCPQSGPPHRAAVPRGDGRAGEKAVPQLSHTAIRELDRLAEAITQLNSELLTNSTKFLRIMDMASVELGGYELRIDTGSVYVTDNFFALLGAPEPKGAA